jgi:DNA-binding transcriptional regulator YiaG
MSHTARCHDNRTGDAVRVVTGVPWAPILRRRPLALVATNPSVADAAQLAAEIGAQLDSGADPKTLAERVEQLVDMVRVVEPHVSDDFASRHLLSAALEIETSLRTRPAATPTSLRLGVETIRQALVRVAEDAWAADDAPLHELVERLLTTTHLSVPGLAAILDVDASTVRRWQEPRDAGAPETQEMLKARVLARVVARLRHVFTARGVVEWLREPHPALKGRAPAELLGEPGSVRDVVGLAAHGRSQIAS